MKNSSHFNEDMLELECAPDDIETSLPSEGLPDYVSFEISVFDSSSGCCIPRALISIDSLSTTAICNAEGKVLLENLPIGPFDMDIICPGYIAESLKIKAGQKWNTVGVRMRRSVQLL